MAPKPVYSYSEGATGVVVRHVRYVCTRPMGQFGPSRAFRGSLRHRGVRDSGKGWGAGAVTVSAVPRRCCQRTAARLAWRER